MELREIIYPKDWTIIQIGKLCKTFTKQTGFDYSNHIKPTLVDKKTDKNVPFIQNKDFNGFKINYLTDYYVPLDVAVRFPMILLDERCLLISISGSIGKVGVFDNKNTAFIGGAVAVGKFHKPLYLDWVKHYLLSNDGQYKLLSKVKAGSHQNLILDDIRKISIPLPNETEQQAIAYVLSDTDQLIQNLKTLIAKKKAIKQGAMQELLTGKKRLQGFTEEWETKKLEEIAFIQRGASPRPINDPIWFDEKSTVGWVRISDVTKSTKFLSKTVQKFSEQGINNSRFVSSDSLIMSICATIGRPIITEINVCIHDGFVVFRDLKLDKEFLYYYLTFIEDDWSKNGQTGSQMNLNTGLINQTEIKYPLNETEQQAIAQILSDMDAEIEALEQQLQKTQTLKQGMMQELLTGKIRLVKPAIKREPKIIRINQEWVEKESSIIAMIVSAMEIPIGHFRYQKYMYLFHRHADRKAKGFKKFAAGPYNSSLRYDGPEDYVNEMEWCTVKKLKSGNPRFTKGIFFNEAKQEYLSHYSISEIKWVIDNFKFSSDDELELYTTVDMAMEELKSQKKSINIFNIKQIIKEEKEWKNKLKKPIFSDENIKTAINKINQLFG